MSNIQNLLQSNITFIPAVVCYLVIDGKVCLAQRKTSSSGLGVSIVAGIGGKVGDTPEIANETIEEALVREAQEEVGVTPIKFERMGRVRFIYPDKPKWQQDVTIFVVTTWQGEPIETDSMKPEWFDMDNLPFERMWADNKHWVPRVLKGEQVDVVFVLGKDSEIIELEVIK